MYAGDNVEPGGSRLAGGVGCKTRGREGRKSLIRHNIVHG